MKLLLIQIFITIQIIYGAKLPANNYLPPPSFAGSSGGHGGFLQSPTRPTSQYLPPTTLGTQSGSTNVFGSGSHGGGSVGYGNNLYNKGYGGGAGQYQSHGPPIPILKYENINNGDGSYHFEYITGNGISQNEQGYLNNPGSDYAEQVVQGSYSYTGDDGHVYTVHYKADANGFHATGDHLPTPPPIPEAIQKSLIYNAQHAQSGHQGGGDYSYNNDGQYKQTHQSGNIGYSNRNSNLGYSHNRPQSQYLPPSRPSHNPNTGYHY